MKYYIFYREDNNFDDILNNRNIKKIFTLKLQFEQHLMLGGLEIPEDIKSYILLKYGDDLKNNTDILIDRKPVPFVDYTPDSKRPNKFKNL